LTTSTLRLLTVISIFIIVRLITIIYFPLQDSTEARYAEIARIMAETGDWITPYFDYDIPFWGKPPLVFWLEALSIKIFGFSDFSPRLPSLLATLGTARLIYIYLKNIRDEESALWGVIIFLSTGLVYILSGVVILDPIFVFATTLAYISFLMVLQRKAYYWGYLFFIAIALGLLTKGPLILVIVGGTIGFWLLFSKKRWRVFTYYPWISGLTLMLFLTIPWYILAELKTPGFLDYFIVGEHFQRFIDSGWQGDKYGTAHNEPHGYIIAAWLLVSLPWGATALLLFIRSLFPLKQAKQFLQKAFNEINSFYIMWAIFTLLFFTFSGNVLSTYVLPSLPALAIIMALYLPKYLKNREFKSKIILYSLLIEPLLIMLALSYATLYPQKIATEKYLMARYTKEAQKNEPLFYLDSVQFSARYYSQGNVKKIRSQDLKAWMIKYPDRSFYLAVRHGRSKRLHEIDASMLEKRYTNSRYYLYKVTQQH